MTCSSSEDNNINDIIEYMRKKIISIKLIWISHPHADHHLGIIRLLTLRQTLLSSSTSSNNNNNNDPVLIIAPISIFYFLREYSLLQSSSNNAVINFQRSYVQLQCLDILYNKKSKYNIFSKKLDQDFGIYNIQSIPVIHCPNSYAVYIQTKKFTFGKSIVYSGDCRPSYKLADIAYNTDILIHEATFSVTSDYDGIIADLQQEAINKKHSTINEAIDVAKRMNVQKCLILTHFSQRYPKLPSITTTAVTSSIHHDHKSNCNGNNSNDNDKISSSAITKISTTNGMIDTNTKEDENEIILCDNINDSEDDDYVVITKKQKIDTTTTTTTTSTTTNEKEKVDIVTTKSTNDNDKLSSSLLTIETTTTITAKNDNDTRENDKIKDDIKDNVNDSNDKLLQNIGDINSATTTTTTTSATNIVNSTTAQANAIEEENFIPLSPIKQEEIEKKIHATTTTFTTTANDPITVITQATKEEQEQRKQVNDATTTTITNDNDNKTEVENMDVPIIFGFDFMKLKSNTINIASRITPALQLLYPDTNDDYDDDNDKEGNHG